MKKEDTIDFHIKTAWHAISRLYNQKAQTFGYSMSVGFILLNINPEVGTRATSIAPLIGLEPTSLARSLKTMEEQGLIERYPDPEDGRAVIIKLTETGRLGRKLARNAVLDFNESITKNLSESELKNFFQVITKINKLLTDI